MTVDRHDAADLPKPRLPFPPSVMRVMESYWRRRPAEVEAAIQAEACDDPLEFLAGEHIRISAWCASRGTRSKCSGGVRSG